MACATMPETSPVFAGRISVLFVLASSWKAVTYFSATASEAALWPLDLPRDWETTSRDLALAAPAAMTASAAPWAALISSCFSASEENI